VWSLLACPSRFGYVENLMNDPSFDDPDMQDIYRCRSKLIGYGFRQSLPNERLERRGVPGDQRKH
jgi:hypothetical protein